MDHMYSLFKDNNYTNDSGSKDNDQEPFPIRFSYFLL